ncbi:hypothetical protein Bbelb_393750 [Branchiostoma belcheri]|nr:hypothetical protein Bbelb_393750 [Branchiostoma belcheri]
MGSGSSQARSRLGIQSTVLYVWKLRYATHMYIYVNYFTDKRLTQISPARCLTWLPDERLTQILPVRCLTWSPDKRLTQILPMKGQHRYYLYSALPGYQMKD